LQFAIEYYHNCLLTSTDKIQIKDKHYTPLEYQIEIRKHTLETLKMFKIGWAGGGLVKYLFDNRFKAIDLKQLTGALFLNPQNIVKDRYYKCFVYPYFYNGMLCNINSKNPIEKKSYKFSGKFGGDVLFYNQDSLKNNTQILIVEGENDILSIVGKTEWKSGLVATGGCLSENQLNKIKELSTTNKIYLCFDNDNAGKSYIYKIFNNLTETINNIYVCSFSGFKDIDELLCNIQDTKSEFNRIIEKSKLIKDYFETPSNIGKQIDIIKDDKTLSSDAKLRNMSKLLISYLSKNGKFFHNSRELSFYYYFNDTCKIYDIEKINFSIFLNNLFMFNPSKFEYKFLLEDLKVRCVYHGKEITINRKPFYYNDTIKQLYIYNYENTVYRLNGKTIDKINNGDDDVYFLCSGDTFNILDNNEIPESADIDRLFFDYINFIPTENSTLNAIEQKFLFKIYFYSLFLPELFKARPIICFIGDKGAGKSFALNLIPMLLTGKSELSNINTENDFNSILTNNYFCFIDNIDENIGKNKTWLLDKIASVSTGIVIKLRKLYANCELIEFNPNVWIGITSRTTAINRDDIADRSLIFRLKPIKNKSFFNESDILKKLKDNRNLIFTLIIQELNRIIYKLQTNETIKYTNFRMSDWAAFAQTIVKNETVNIENKEISAENYLKGVIDKMQKQQTNFSNEGDCFIEVVKEYLAEHEELSGKTADIYNNLLLFVKNRNLGDIKNFYFFKSVLTFGMVLNHKFEQLKEDFICKKNRLTGNTNWQIKVKNVF